LLLTANYGPARSRQSPSIKTVQYVAIPDQSPTLNTAQIHSIRKTAPMTNLAFPPIPVDFDTDHLANEITLLAGQINAANHRLLKLIAQFDQRKGWSGGGTVRSCAHWL